MSELLWNLGQPEDDIFINLTARSGVCAPPGKLLVSLDFSNQEAQIAAVVSRDQLMCNVFRSQEKLQREDSSWYVNPDSDMHTLTTAYCVDPEKYAKLPRDQWREEADRSGDRKIAKILNFAILYMATAVSIAESNYVKEEVAKKWVEAHKETYKDFHKWAQQEGNIASILGYAYGAFTPYNVCRFVAEENAKGSGESPARSAVNHMIQGTASIITKMAVNRIRKAIKGTRTVIVGVIHDEVLIETPGYIEPITESIKRKDNGLITSIKWKTSKEVETVINQIKQIMCDVETELYQAYGSDVVGRAGSDPAPYWAH